MVGFSLHANTHLHENDRLETQNDRIKRARPLIAAAWGATLVPLSCWRNTRGGAMKVDDPVERILHESESFLSRCEWAMELMRMIFNRYAMPW